MSATEHHRLRHARIKEILYEVSSLEGSARADFLTGACAGDRELRHEVESLLRYFDAQADAALRPDATLPKAGRDETEPRVEPSGVGEADPASATSKPPARRAGRKRSP